MGADDVITGVEGAPVADGVAAFVLDVLFMLKSNIPLAMCAMCVVFGC